MLSRHHDLLTGSALIAGVVVLALISIPALNGPLVLDSTKLLSLEGLVREHGQRAILHTPPFGRGVLDRVVSMASFVLNIQAAGELSTFQLKLANLLIHFVNAVLVFIFTKLVVRTTPLAPRAGVLAAGTALLWLLSPVNFNTTLYTIQRMAQLSALFTFAGLVLYTAGRLQERTGKRRCYIALSLLVCLPLAVFSKQNGALLVLFALLVEVYFLHRLRPWFAGRQWALIVVAGAGAAVALAFYLYPGALSYHGRDFTLGERLLSQPRALISYLQHILLPLGGDTGIFSDDFKASTSLLKPLSTIPALFTCAAMAVFCLLCRRGRFAVPAFGLAFFLGGHLLESTVIPLELYFLHRNYLPSLGVYLAAAWFIVTLSPDKRWSTLLLCIYPAYFIAIDFARSLTWSDREQIYAAAVHHHPDSPRALMSYAQAAVKKREFQLALTANNRATELTASLNTRIQRLYILCRAGAAIPASEYTALQDSKNFGVSNELGQALDNLLAVYGDGDCARLDIPSLVESLDRLAERYAASGGNPWLIAYHADALLYASGRKATTHRRLQRRLEAGHLASGLLRLELLMAEGRPGLAATILDLIEARFPRERLQKYAGELDDYRERLRNSD